jgi:hypothetical protein
MSKFISDDEMARLEASQPKKKFLSDAEMKHEEEQEFLAQATKKADQAFDAPSKLESGLRGAAQGATFGYADEIAGAMESLITNKPYRSARDESREAFKKAEESNPKTYMAGDLGATLASSFIPGLNVAKGASLAKAAAKTAGLGAAEGLGRSEGGNLKDLAKDTALSAGLGAGFSAGADLVGAGLRGVKKAVPGFEGSSPIANKLASKAAATTGLDEKQAAFYETLLGDPNRAAKALSNQGRDIDPDPSRIALEEALEGIKREVSERYGKARGDFVKENLESPSYMQDLGGVSSDLEEALEITRRDPSFFSPLTRRQLSKSQKTLQGEAPYPTAGEELFKVRDYLQEGIEGAGRGARPDKDSRELLGQLKERLQGRIESMPGGGNMRKQDAMYSQFKDQEKSIDKLLGRNKNTRELDSKKVLDLLGDRGGRETAAGREETVDNLRDFLKAYDLSGEALESSLRGGRDMQDVTNLGRLGGQSGQTTGRNLKNIGYGLLAGSVTSNPVVGAVVSGVSKAATDPVGYLKAVQTARNLATKLGAEKTAQLFGAYWPAVRSAIARGTIASNHQLENSSR